MSIKYMNAKQIPIKHVCTQSYSYILKGIKPECNCFSEIYILNITRNVQACLNGRNLLGQNHPLLLCTTSWVRLNGMLDDVG